MPDTAVSAPTAGTGTSDIIGSVNGGRQPITGAHIYLYGALAVSGTPAAGKSLLGNVVSTLSPSGTCNSSVVAPLYYDGTNCYYLTTTGTGTQENPGGEFNLTGLYNCTVNAVATAPTEVWLYSIGGNPGVVGGTTIFNPAASLTAALGSCPSSGNFSTPPNALSYLYVNEVSTVAFAYATAGFSSDAKHVSAAPGTYKTNLVNAFANASQLYDIQGGADPGDHGARQHTPLGNGLTPFLLVNSLANVLSTCINSNNTSNVAGSGQSVACATFFSDVYGSSSYASTVETASAAIYIAQNPYNTVPLTVATSETPWTPNYTTAAESNPSDLTAAITFTGINSAYGVAIDSGGNAYVTENLNPGAVIELSPVGVQTATSGTLNQPSGITIDNGGNIWAPGRGSANGVLNELHASTLTAYSGSPYNYGPTTPGTPVALSNANLQIAADASGFVYIADAGATPSAGTAGLIVVINKSTPLTAADLPNTKKCTNSVGSVAYSAANTSIWVASAGSGTADDVCDLNKSTGAIVGTASYNVGGTASNIAIDSTGTPFITTGNSSLYKITTSNGAISSTSSGGLSNAGAIAIDGANNVWVLNNSGFDSSSSTPPSISECLNTFSYCDSPSATRSNPASGYQYGQLSYPKGIAIDGSGDVWVSNYGANSVVELIGAAVPVVAPIFNGGGKPAVIESVQDEE